MHHSNKQFIGIDIGGTKISGGRILDSQIHERTQLSVPSTSNKEVVLECLYEAIDRIFDSKVDGIGVGVPSIVDDQRGIVYDVQNIPSWKEVPIKALLEDRYNIPVYVNNDANCFVVGEKRFGLGKPFKNLMGITIGTGLGMGLIIHDHLYSGLHCGAGELGMIPFHTGIMEEFASAMYFKNKYQKNGIEMHDMAKNGDKQALLAFEELGKNLGKALLVVLYIFAPEAIVLGGSMSKSFELFKDSMFKELDHFIFRNQMDSMKIFCSNNPDISILGASALYLDKNGYAEIS